MDLMPHQVMRLVQLGDESSVEKLLASATIWSCAGCLTCTQRCPQELDPAAVMDVLRERSYHENKVSPKQKKVLALVRRYKIASLDFMSDVALVPPMLVRGKLKFLSHKAPGRKDVRKIFAACRPSAAGKGGPESHRMGRPSREAQGRKRGER
jgi:heterodisulfide reductase subunit C